MMTIPILSLRFLLPKLLFEEKVDHDDWLKYINLSGDYTENYNNSWTDLRFMSDIEGFHDPCLCYEGFRV